MGIDLGITKVATMSIYDIEKHKYKEMYWKDQTIDGTELIHYRQKIEARRKSLSIASKWASDNAIGHGYKRRMKKANNIGDKYNRFKDTYNHKVSRYIVDLAYKHGVKTIQMEDLSGFSEHQSESLLKNWSYYDLQNKIKYKAEEKGINTIFINPQYTSKRCSKCGNIHEENRDCKNNQAKFECIICGHKENADINASKNIAIPYIDKIIKEYIKDTI
ncbi:transposase [Clostridium perfringens]|nr:transposase [Clostridium perfringens]MDM0588317.1 transposase [Clostridium perfringens]